VDLFMAGRMPLDRLITRYNFAEINRAAADATSGAGTSRSCCCRTDIGAGVFQNPDRNKSKN
jgi:Zn-dependent alcohol dehydrogenase